jgi:hypothetical protein
VCVHKFSWEIIINFIFSSFVSNFHHAVIEFKTHNIIMIKFWVKFSYFLWKHFRACWRGFLMLKISFLRKKFSHENWANKHKKSTSAR